MYAYTPPCALLWSRNNLNTKPSINSMPININYLVLVNHVKSHHTEPLIHSNVLLRYCNKCLVVIKCTSVLLK